MSNWDPAKHPREPSGSNIGGQFTHAPPRATDRAAGAQMARMIKAHADAKKHAHKLKHKTELEIAIEAGYPPAHEQHWAFRNGLAFASRQNGTNLMPMTSSERRNLATIRSLLGKVAGGKPKP